MMSGILTFPQQMW